jgi:hypothetical protein
MIILFFYLPVKSYYAHDHTLLLPNGEVIHKNRIRCNTGVTILMYNIFKLKL